MLCNVRDISEAESEGWAKFNSITSSCAMRKPGVIVSIIIVSNKQEILELANFILITAFDVFSLLIRLNSSQVAVGKYSSGADENCKNSRYFHVCDEVT